MGPRVLALLALVGALACRREAPPVEPRPDPQPASEPTVWAELAPSESASITSTELCDHVATIMIEEASGAVQFDDEEFDRFRTECIAELDRERMSLGDQEFHRQAICVMAADDFVGIEACDADEVASEEYEAICEHVFTIVFRESGVASADALEPEALQECVDNLEKERATMAPEEYVRQRDCVFQATTVAQLEACDGP